MTRGRGICCTQCTNKIDRYDDSIECANCANSYHIKCANLSLESYNKLRENCADKWICENCRQMGENASNFINRETQTAEYLHSTMDFSKLREQIVADISAIFFKEINDLKTIITNQSKQIKELSSELRSFKKQKNLIAAPHDSNTPSNQPVRNIPDDSSLSSASVPLNVTPACIPDKEIPKLNETLTGDLCVTGENSSEWSTVTKRRKRKNPRNSPAVNPISPRIPISETTTVTKKINRPLVGTLKSNILHVAPKKQLSYLHVSRLSPETTVLELQNFLKEHIQNVSCEKLNSKQPELYSSFKVSLPTEYFNTVMNPEFWPEGIAVNKFFIKRHQPVVTS
ncbi:uncharacterized protein LOC123309099 [Coccinella septempunctata]|uniref:uncharacterized protein LOC123309099 n=1 Tax=Coccinella septempunctata TaxID=41139 RepID=UPI001D06288A|nr:uncharacterized protein LOC123309099 [Coccinella septempunctata]